MHTCTQVFAYCAKCKILNQSERDRTKNPSLCYTAIVVESTVCSAILQNAHTRIDPMVLFECVRVSQTIFRDDFIGMTNRTGRSDVLFMSCSIYTWATNVCVPFTTSNMSAFWGNKRHLYYNESFRDVRPFDFTLNV